MLQRHAARARGATACRARHGVGAVSRVFTVAVVGCGIGRSHIVEGYLPNAGKFKVIAVCDLNPERMNALGDEFGIERRTSQFDELLAMDDVDIVDICTPPMVHYEQVLAAQDRKSTRLNSSHVKISYAVFCLK